MKINGWFSFNNNENKYMCGTTIFQHFPQNNPGRFNKNYIERESNPCSGLFRPRWFQKVENPRLQGKWHTKVEKYIFLLEAELIPGP